MTTGSIAVSIQDDYFVYIIGLIYRGYDERGYATRIYIQDGWSAAGCKISARNGAGYYWGPKVFVERNEGRFNKNRLLSSVQSKYPREEARLE